MIASKATKLLNVLYRTMFGCSTLAKDEVYKSIVKPSMEYACQVWNPHTEKDCVLLDAIQNRAARCILKSRWYPESLRRTKSSRECVLTLNWPFLSTRRMYFIIMFLFNIQLPWTAFIYYQISPFATISRHKKSQVYISDDFFHH